MQIIAYIVAKRGGSEGARHSPPYIRKRYYLHSSGYFSIEQMSDGEWETFTSKKTIKKEKAKEHRDKLEQIRRERDILYLRTHVGFQKNRLTRNKALHLIADKKPEGTLFLMSCGRCVGHLVAVTPKKYVCVECDTCHDKTVHKSGEFWHCCCSEDVKTSLPPHFYLGCDGHINNYLALMKEEPIDSVDSMLKVERVD